MKRSEISPALRALVSMAVVACAVTTVWAQPSATTTTLSLSSGSVSAGSVVTLTASVTAGATPVPAGLVLFCNANVAHCEDSAVFGSAWMTTAGTATIHKIFGSGSYNIRAVFQGTNLYATSPSAATPLTVTSPPPTATTTLSVTGTPGSYDLSAALAANSATPPTGSISFLDTSNGNFLLGSGVLGAPVLTTSYTSTPPPVTTESTRVAVADFNNDGYPDIAVLNPSGLGNGSTLSILLGQGGGAFETGASYTVCYSATQLVTADFNGDGNLDIAVSCNSGASAMSILLGNGDGTFTAVASPALPTPLNLTWMAVGDFNGDGVPDLVVTDYTDDGVLVLLGNGNGTFTPQALMPLTQPQPYGVVAADFNGDGKTDIAVMIDNNSTSTWELMIFLGNGDGTFTAGGTYPTGETNLQVVEGDFNGDGIADLATINFRGGSVSVLQGNGDGTFTTVSTPTVSASPKGVALGDFNGDGILDIATSDYYTGQVTILQGNGNGTFTTSSVSPVTGSFPTGIAAADLNGDGLLDIVSSNQGNTPTVLLQSVALTATATVSGISVWGNGTQELVASYGGDSNYASSTSAPVPVAGTPLPAPVLNLASGTYLSGQILTISTAAGSVYYTTDGSMPSMSSNPYSGAITLTSSGTITAIAVVGPSVASPVAAATYNIVLPQTISFTNPGDQTYGVAPLTLVATSTSGLPVSLAVIAGPAFLTGNTLTITAAGAVTVQATQAGNSTYAAAEPVSINFAVNPTLLTLTTTPSPLNFGAVPVGTVSPSTLAVSFAVPSSVVLGGVTALTVGAASLDFTFTSNTCISGTTNTNCTVVIQFLPTAIGLRTGMLVFSDQSGNTLLSVPLSGTGTGPLVGFGPGIISTLTSGVVNNPYGLAVNAAGYIYIADWNNNLVHELTPGGVMTTIAGGGSGCAQQTDSLGDGCPATEASLNGAATVKLDGTGNRYIADYYNNRIRKVTAAGIISTVAGGGSGCAQQTDSLGDGCPATSASLNGPWGTLSDGVGNLYIGDTQNNVVRKVALDGTITTFAGNGSGGYSGDGGPATSAQLNGPQMGAVDAAGNVYIVDFNNSVIRMVSPSGIITTVAGTGAAGYSGDGGPATSAQLYYPQMIAVDAAGDLYIADCYNHRIRKVTPGGIITTVAGTGTAGYNGDGFAPTSAELYYPSDVALDGLGNVYIADTFNNSIRKVDYSDAPSLNFGSVSFGQASAAQDVILLNLGDLPLTINSISVAPNFSLGGADTTCSTGSQMLAPSANCVLGIELIPTMTGSISGSVVLTDSNLNISGNTQTIALQGAGTPAAQEISVSTPGALIYGVGSVPLGGAVTSSIRAGRQSGTQMQGAKPSVAAPALNISASSGLPVNVTVISGPATISGDSLIVNGAGVVTIQATQPGNANYNAAVPVSVKIPVNPAPLTLTASNEVKEYGWPVPALSGSLTGVVAGDGITASYATTAGQGSPAGTYPITATLNDPENRLSNYSVTIAGGTLIVNSPAVSTPLELSLSPSSATAGGAKFTITVNGANFAANSVVLWNGSVRATKYVSSTQLTASILAGDIAKEGTNLVTVASPAPDAGTSAALPFVVQSGSPAAVIAGTSLALGNSGNYVLTVTGRNFVPASTVNWNGLSLATTYVSPWQLTAIVTTGEYASRPATVTVTNPSGTSPGFGLH